MSDDSVGSISRHRARDGTIRYRARLHVEGTRQSLGVYDTEAEAEDVLAAAIERRGATSSGNRRQRHLPGLYVPSTEIIDRVRWERGPRASRMPGAVWNLLAHTWMRAPH